MVHGLKVLMKEDFSPTGSDRIVFTLAPVVVYMSAVMTLLVIPFAPGLFGQDFNIGLLYLFAVSGLTVVGLLMGGWSSFNKYSLLGGLRSAAQVISYEIPLTLSVVGLLLLAGTMSLNQLAINQAGWFTNWYVFQQPLGALIFFIAATAEANRTPFDLTEADSEIVAGFATEYSGMRFGFFFFAEYVNVFVVSGLIVTLFFGGWNAPFAWPEAWAIHLNLDPGLDGARAAVRPPDHPADPDPRALRAVLRRPQLAALVAGADHRLHPVQPARDRRRSAAPCSSAGTGSRGCCGSSVKSYTFVFIFVWMRGTLPRVRIDQLMNFAWKWLLPASLLNLFVTAAAVLIVLPR